MIKDLVQTTLDNALYDEGIYTFDQRKTGHDTDEYIVYTQAGDPTEFSADDETLIKKAIITVKYFYRAEKLNNYKDRQTVRETEDTIENALIGAGFIIPYGRFDAGDVDDIGYMVTVFECEYWRVV